MPSKILLNIIVAACNNMGIGIEGRLPWRLKKDMAFFKKITSATVNPEKQNMVIMGKNTWQSIPHKFRPLAGRVNVVLSTQLTEAPQGAHLARTFNEAVELADRMSDKVENIFVIGGASVYKAAMENENPCRIYLTRVCGDFTCDTFLPDFDRNIFRQVNNPGDVDEGVCEENGIKFSFEVYIKE